MNFLPYQLERASRLLDIFNQRGYAYLQGKPRTGKSPTALSMCEMTHHKNIAIICPKGARGDAKKGELDGWAKFIQDEELGLRHNYTIIHYENIYKKVKTEGIKKGKVRYYNSLIKDIDTLTEQDPTNPYIETLIQECNSLKVFKYEYPLRYDPSEFDLVILDEAHNVGGVGKPSLRFKTLKEFCYDKPVLYLSGTAITENPVSIYYQTSISKYCPFPYPSFYDFFTAYGIPHHTRIKGRMIPDYTHYRKELLDIIASFSVGISQEMAGIAIENQVKDKVHYVELHPIIRKIANDLVKHRAILIPTHYTEYIPSKEIDFDTVNLDKILEVPSLPKLRGILGHIENGILEGEYLGNIEKIEYIKKTFGDTEDMVIMSHFPKERELLQEHFHYAQVLSSTKYSEGVNLSHIKYLIIISQDYRGAKYIQRRERIANINGGASDTVHFIVSKGMLSEQIYESVAHKMDFTTEVFKKYLNCY